MFNKIRHWYHHKRYLKLARKLAMEPIGSYVNKNGETVKILFTDYFMVTEKIDVNEPCYDSIYLKWRPIELQEDADLNMEKHIVKDHGIEYWHLSIDNTIAFITKSFIRQAQENIKEFLVIKKAKRVEPYLKDYECQRNGNTVNVVLTPYYIEGYITAVREAHPEIDADVINEYRNDYIQEFAQYSVATANQPRVMLPCFNYWYEYNYKFRKELEKRNSECKAVLDEIKTVREARKENKDA